MNNVSPRRARIADAAAIVNLVNDAYRPVESFFIRGDTHLYRIQSAPAEHR